jgi:hypothetical protein
MPASCGLQSQTSIPIKEQHAIAHLFLCVCVFLLVLELSAQSCSTDIHTVNVCWRCGVFFNLKKPGRRHCQSSLTCCIISQEQFWLEVFDVSNPRLMIDDHYGGTRMSNEHENQ